MSHVFHIVDVFAETRYGGNQLAVVLDADDLTEARMHQIALETNFSETTFVLSGSGPDAGYPVRIFTPAQELPFAGHPVLGTAWVIRNHVAQGHPDIVDLELGVGRVPVRFEHDSDGAELAWFRAPAIELGVVAKPEPIAEALGIKPGEIDSHGPIQHVSAGVQVMIVPVRGREVLDRCRLDLHAFEPLARQGFPPFIYVFCAEPVSSDNDLVARFFFDANGVREDPATGSATACLGAYLLEHEFLGDGDLSLRIEQGAALHRPSLLLLRGSDGGGAREIHVGGNVIPTMTGAVL